MSSFPAIMFKNTEKPSFATTCSLSTVLSSLLKNPSCHLVSPYHTYPVPRSSREKICVVCHYAESALNI